MRVFVLLLLCVLFTGCASSGNLHKYMQSQITAITPRSVDADMDRTFRAATSALFDAGYTILVSDREAGILTGHKGDSRAAERFWISPAMEDVDFRVSIMLSEDGYQQTKARVSMSQNGEQLIDEEAVDQLWTLMRRQVLIQDPVSIQDSE